jgi:hypothetical protein
VVSSRTSRIAAFFDVTYRRAISVTSRRRPDVQIRIVHACRDRLGSTNDRVDTSIARRAGLEEETGKGFFERDVSLLRNDPQWYILKKCDEIIMCGSFCKRSSSGGERAVIRSIVAGKEAALDSQISGPTVSKEVTS